MKLSVWSSYYIDLSPEDMVLEYERNGYGFCELSDEHSDVLLKRGEPHDVGARFKAFANAHGVAFPQGHLYLRARITKESDRADVKRQIDLFEAIGTKYAVLHCDPMNGNAEMSDEDRFKENVKAIGDLIEYIGERDIVICLENMRETPNAKTSEQLLRFIELLGDEHLGICLDTGHLNLAALESQAEFIRRAGRHVRALHVADNEGVYDQHILPFGRGTVNVVEVVRETKAIGYDGLYNLEIPGERKCPLEIRAAKLAYIKAMFEYLQKI